MRVLRYILRFLGISAIILYFIASISRADDVTVNFPSTMEVTGTVSIDGLGIDGDPSYDNTAPAPPDGFGLNRTQTGLNESSQNAETYQTSYIGGYKKILIWNGSLQATNTVGTNASTYNDSIYILLFLFLIGQRY